MTYSLSHDDRVIRIPQRSEGGSLPARIGVGPIKLAQFLQAMLASARDRLAVLPQRRRQREILAQLRFVQRMRERRALAQLSDRDLWDIGLSRYDAEMESRKPFWRA